METPHTPPTRASLRRAGRFRARIRRVLASAAVAAIALTGVVVGVAAPAQAADFGPGYGTQDDNIGWMGAYRIPGTGTLVFCIEPGIPTPTGTTTFAGNVGVGFTSNSFSGATYTPTADELARINAIIGTYGVGNISNREASAVHFAVQYLGNPQGMFGSGGYNNRDSDLHGFINWKLYSTIGTAEVNAVYARTMEILNATAGVTAGDGTTNITGSLVFAVDPTNNYVGTVTPQFSSGNMGAGTITLTNGIFTSTGTPTISGATAGVALPIEGVPPYSAEDGFAEEYKISGTGTFDAGSGSWAAELELYTTGNQQRTVASAGRVDVSVPVSGEDPMVRGVTFEPIVTTSAPRFVTEGEVFVDEVTATLATEQPWTVNSNGDAAPVVAKGTLYGSLSEEPIESADVPTDAPDAGTAEVTLTGEGTYAVESDVVASTPGYYTWVWTIDAADQRAGVQRLLPENYFWADAFGQRVETSITPPRVSTQAQPSTKLGGEITDTAIVEGVVPNETTLTFEAFKVPTNPDGSVQFPEGFVPSEDEGVTNLEWVCEADPVFVQETPVEVTGAGEYVSEAFTPTEHGKYLWVETLWVEGTPVHTGKCGVAEETSFVLDVTTRAQTIDGDQTVGLGEAAWDKAILNGYVPEGATVTIVGYQTPKSTPVADACVAENVVFEWTSEPLAGGMAENLEVDSDRFAPDHFDADQAIYFVETTKDALGRTVSEGECGEPDETLTVEAGAGDLQWTGGDSAPALWVGGASAMALLAGAILYIARRRQMA